MSRVVCPEPPTSPPTWSTTWSQCKHPLWQPPCGRSRRRRNPRSAIGPVEHLPISCQQCLAPPLRSPPRPDQEASSSPSSMCVIRVGRDVGLVIVSRRRLRPPPSGAHIRHSSDMLDVRLRRPAPLARQRQRLPSLPKECCLRILPAEGQPKSSLSPTHPVRRVDCASHRLADPPPLRVRHKEHRNRQVGGWARRSAHNCGKTPAHIRPNTSCHCDCCGHARCCV